MPSRLLILHCCSVRSCVVSTIVTEREEHSLSHLKKNVYWTYFKSMQFNEVLYGYMLYNESLTHPSLLPFRMPSIPRMLCSENIGLGSRGTSHRWDLCMVAHIYISHTGMCLYHCTACHCLSYRQLCPWSRSSHHQSNHHYIGTRHKCTALGLHTTFWMRFVIKLDLEH